MRLSLPLPRLVSLLGILLISILGWACVALPFGEPIARLSYDLPFALRSAIATPELCLVTLDEQSARELKQPLDKPWDRRLHTELVRVLTEEGARAILFDIVFDLPSDDPATDEAFAAAIKEHGRVFLGGDMPKESGAGFAVQRIVEPIPMLKDAAAGWGLLVFDPLDPDYGVRQMFTGTEQVVSAPWKVAHALGAPIPAATDRSPRWLNYYGPARTLAKASVEQALRPRELPPGFFKDRIVFVGGRMSLGGLAQQKDEFFTPHTRWGEPFAAGVEIHATALLNLLRGEWLTRASQPLEEKLIVLFAAAVTALFTWLRPPRAAVVAFLFAGLIAALALWSIWHRQVWWNWVVPAGIVTPAALAWSVGANYLLEVRRRTKMHNAFARYFSEHVADQIEREKFNVKVGGELVEATMLFTDLQGFTDLSEKLQEPQEVSDVLVEYFNNTTQHVLKNQGTVIKYAGDSIFAAWGAPETDKQQADHAVQAAWDLHQFAKFNVRGHHLITRIGVNSGRVVAGNLGSNLRFDYTLTGDATNFASRLEGLNKYLQTQVLISEFTLRSLKSPWAVRSTGRFRVKGKLDAVEVFELLGPSVSRFVQGTMDTFAAGLKAYCARDFATARKLFEQTRTECEGDDGPSKFYLQKITALEQKELPKEWNGIVDLDEK